MTFKYEIHTRGKQSHLISWSDGLHVLVTGTWAEAVELAECRQDRETLRILTQGLRITARDLREAADAADRASLEVETVTRAATIRRAVAQAPRSTPGDASKESK